MIRGKEQIKHQDCRNEMMFRFLRGLIFHNWLINRFSKSAIFERDNVSSERARISLHDTDPSMIISFKFLENISFGFM